MTADLLPATAPPAPPARRRRSGTLLVLVAALATVLVGAVMVVLPSVGAWGILAGLACLELVALTAYRPVFAVYAYMATLPFLGGIDRGTLIPLVRPSEGLLALLTLGAAVGYYVRYLRGERIEWRWHPVDRPLLAFLLLSTVWPLVSYMLQGQMPQSSDYAAILPVCKLVGLYLLVRLAVVSEDQMVRMSRVIVWPGAALAVIAILQTLNFGPVVSLLETYWASPGDDPQAITERGSATLASPIATGDYIVISLVLLIILSMRGRLGRREGLALGLILGTGVLAAGQYSIWICAVVAGWMLLRRYPRLRPRVVRLLPAAVVVCLVGAPAVIARIGEFQGTGLPVSWLGRIDNLSNFFLPRFDPLHIAIGVAPNPVLQAPETWRDVIYLENGYLYFLWIGGLPLLAGFAWLTVVVLRHLRGTAVRAAMPGAYAAALYIVWWVLLIVTVIDPHLEQRGTGDLIFAMLAMTVGRGREPRHG
ncbi:hypothetical protein [Pseudonocardia acidicola]|uniref:O-antigen ligase n=1 Tax=Pseudonocardia acidicola TaxID=2724939 RepID=A0ABX1SFF6_9PSEU|nr:hypothetical protein [Pseudonocardia acidicola]NMI00272.1 hypothetical protein [Pseudonocardia acidicola]